MERTTMRGRICGTGSYIPEHYYDNNDLAKCVETNDEWIRERTGIVRRHIAEEDTTVSMAVKAAKNALTDAKLNADDLDLILVSTITPNTVIPSTACEVQKELGAVNATCFDISAACSGFVYAYNTAQAYIAAGMYQNILVIGSETLSGIVNWKDRGSCILFGDGAVAAVICAEEGEIFPAVTHSDGAKGQVLACESRQQKNWQDKENEKQTYVSMDGQAVFKFAVKKVPEVIGELLQKADLTEKDIDLFVLHQANLRIIESVAKRMKTDLAKFPVNIEEYGNTSSASIPILLDELNKTGRLHKGQPVHHPACFLRKGLGDQSIACDLAFPFQDKQFRIGITFQTFFKCLFQIRIRNRMIHCWHPVKIMRHFYVDFFVFCFYFSDHFPVLLLISSRKEVTPCSLRK